MCTGRASWRASDAGPFTNTIIFAWCLLCLLLAHNYPTSWHLPAPAPMCVCVQLGSITYSAAMTLSSVYRWVRGYMYITHTRTCFIIRVCVCVCVCYLPSTMRDLLMLLASSSVLPSELVFLVISEPARSTKLILPFFVRYTPSSAFRDKESVKSLNYKKKTNAVQFSYTGQDNFHTISTNY